MATAEPSWCQFGEDELPRRGGGSSAPAAAANDEGPWSSPASSRCRDPCDPVEGGLDSAEQGPDDDDEVVDVEAEPRGLQKALVTYGLAFLSMRGYGPHTALLVRPDMPEKVPLRRGTRGVPHSDEGEGGLFRAAGLVVLAVLALAGCVALAIAAATAGSAELAAEGVATGAEPMRRLQAAVGVPARQPACVTAAEGELCHRLVTWAMEDGLRLQPERFPALSGDSSFEEFQAALHVQSPGHCAMPCPCHSAQQGEPCHELVVRAMADGLRSQPERFPGLSIASGREAFQLALHRQQPSACPRPCAPKAEAVASARRGSCDYGHVDRAPAPAACFVARDGKLLATRGADGLLDLPHGDSDGAEPAKCTAHRATLEETGYLAAPRELLAAAASAGGGGFKVFRCELVSADPVRKPASKEAAAWVGWLSPEEAKAGSWKRGEAARFAEWAR